MRISLVILLLLLALGCGGATVEDRQKMSPSSDEGEADAESPGPAAAVSDAPVASEEIENRQDFIGNWSEIDEDVDCAIIPFIIFSQISDNLPMVFT